MVFRWSLSDSKSPQVPRIIIIIIIALRVFFTLLSVSENKSLQFFNTLYIQANC